MKSPLALELALTFSTRKETDLGRKWRPEVPPHIGVHTFRKERDLRERTHGLVLWYSGEGKEPAALPSRSKFLGRSHLKASKNIPCFPTYMKYLLSQVFVDEKGSWLASLSIVPDSKARMYAQPRIIV